MTKPTKRRHLRKLDGLSRKQLEDALLRNYALTDEQDKIENSLLDQIVSLKQDIQRLQDRDQRHMKEKEDLNRCLNDARSDARENGEVALQEKKKRQRAELDLGIAKERIFTLTTALRHATDGFNSAAELLHTDETMADLKRREEEKAQRGRGPS